MSASNTTNTLKDGTKKGYVTILVENSVSKDQVYVMQTPYVLTRLNLLFWRDSVR